ncbi:hypothetical protein MACK_003710 [Theileria orientalis]|uniref:Uncharacterized protein n=1 Tax=Theileria orientalis TaxID=68886 RepID=A0A976XJQ3_THEOR|nr:hypothetical protein MACK_003710 [Theileria orientalis]
MNFKVKNIIAVHSCKGGVGKSTVAACLAITFASKGKQVGICDLDICGPSLAELFSVDRDSVKWTEVESTETNRRDRCNKTVNLSYSDDCCGNSGNETSESMCLEPKIFKGVKIMSSEFLRPKNYSGYSAYRGPIIDQVCYEMVYRTNWEDLDYLILDLPPGTSDVMISLVENVHISGSILVTTPHVLSNNDLVKGIKLFNDLEIPILSIVENMAYFTCDSCGNEKNIFGPSNVKSICDEYKIDHFVRLPFVVLDKNERMCNSRSNEDGFISDIGIVYKYHNSVDIQRPLENLFNYVEAKSKYNIEPTIKTKPK